MTIKIKAERVRMWCSDACEDKPHRLVLESDWRKLMRLVKACEDYKECDGAGWVVVAALDALSKEKKK